ncbi:Acetyltransferase (GNAT) family protein [Granulicella pectinivorans]|jgi:N-acetylglutamate synthase-like GNAT family acetyltransferase|uniref:Acetyltransferase (GNAT) family protein n=1 Tax=Granulicella pectinivorans TaxID=474950 RepID=A0A1I6MGQ2_9BACT|nr:GNAT family N-acetyltransferase [Granulicella pectinivorans]SFS14900.1 Acetyltransferase (GNAT) family protein [Granulicella pectinivorans]
MPTLTDDSRTATRIEIRTMHIGDDLTPFRTLNEEWITHFFQLEETDRKTLNNPEEAILRKGGSIFFVEADNIPVGCVALIPMENGVYELSKMAVSPTLRGHGLGRRLLEHTIAEARRQGIKELFLGSSTRLRNAVHLYESLGFQHIPPERRPPSAYSRADVFMEMSL